MEQKYIQTAINYKKNIASKFVLVEGAKLKQRIDGEHFYVTRKVDGHLQLLFYTEEQTLMLNANGKEKANNLKCIDLFTESLKQAGVKQAVIAAELYMPRQDGRPRCGDVATALADSNKRNELCLAPFDIVELDGEDWNGEHYDKTHQRLCDIFQKEMVRPVDMRIAESTDEVKAIYEEWVEGEGAEGLVVHTDSNIVWKVKPRHTIDAAVIGYTTGERGVRDLMMAVRREDGLFQMFALGSTGLSDEDRATVAQRLGELHVDSQYVLSDSRGIAYQMVRPQLVFEISVLELVARGNDDKIRMNPLLCYDENQGWLLEGTTPGVSVLGITFNQERADKQVNTVDIRLSQLTDLCPFEEPEGGSALSLQPSTLLERHVYKKVSGDKVMLHKFLLWKTNKEQSGRYPAYVLYHTDYSSGRKEIIKRDMMYSSDEQQIHELLANEIAANVKKGWEEIIIIAKVA